MIDIWVSHIIQVLFPLLILKLVLPKPARHWVAVSAAVRGTNDPPTNTIELRWLLGDPLGKWGSLLSLGCSVGNKPDREEFLVLVIAI